jgi:hypothetical protein
VPCRPGAWRSPSAALGHHCGAGRRRRRRRRSALQAPGGVVQGGLLQAPCPAASAASSARSCGQPWYGAAVHCILQARGATCSALEAQHSRAAGPPHPPRRRRLHARRVTPPPRPCPSKRPGLALRAGNRPAMPEHTSAQDALAAGPPQRRGLVGRWGRGCVGRAGPSSAMAWWTIA